MTSRNKHSNQSTRFKGILNDGIGIQGQSSKLLTKTVASNSSYEQQQAFNMTQPLAMLSQNHL